MSITAPTPRPAPALTPAELARELNVSAGTIRRWLCEGRLQGTRVGGRLRIDPQAVAEIVRPAVETRSAR